MKDPQLIEQTAWLPDALLERFMVDVFLGIGVPEVDARICADVLITADRRGISSHGISRLKPIYYDRIVRDHIQLPTTNVEVVRDFKSTAVVDEHTAWAWWWRSAAWKWPSRRRANSAPAAWWRATRPTSESRATIR